jgi:hypothetical protein
MQNLVEEWRDIRGWEGLYQVSNLGRVRSLPRTHTRYHPTLQMDSVFHSKGRVLRPGRKDSGYLIVVLSDMTNGRQRVARVHRLVCEAFNGPSPSDDHEVAHNDNTRDNNVATNLRWATHYDNVQDSVNARREANGPR